MFSSSGSTLSRPVQCTNLCSFLLRLIKFGLFLVEKKTRGFNVIPSARSRGFDRIRLITEEKKEENQETKKPASTAADTASTVADVASTDQGGR